MSRSLRRGSIAALAALAIVSLSSCAAGNSPETMQIKPDNVSATLNPDVLLNNIVVVTEAGGSAEYHGPATVVVTIANTGDTPVELLSVTVGAGSAAAFSDDKGAPLPAVVVPAGGSVSIGGKGNPTAQVASTEVHVGGYAPTSFTFKSGSVKAQAAVSSDKDAYKGFGPTKAETTPAAAPTKSASPAAPAPSGSASPSAGATAGATATATAGASGTPSGAASTAAAGH